MDQSSTSIVALATTVHLCLAALRNHRQRSRGVSSLALVPLSQAALPWLFPTPFGLAVRHRFPPRLVRSLRMARPPLSGPGTGGSPRRLPRVWRRLLVGGYAGNIARSGIDLTATDSIIDRPDGSSYQSRYVAVGHQFGRRVYLSGDYSTSLSVVRFTRTDGVTVEFQPHTRRYSATGTWNVNRTISLLVTGERACDDTVTDTRLLCGIGYRIPNR